MIAQQGHSADRKKGASVDSRRYPYFDTAREQKPDHAKIFCVANIYLKKEQSTDH